MNGFTLLEAVVALTIVGLAVVGATEAASRTLRTQQEVSRRAEAAALAGAALDETALLEPDSLESWRDVAVEDVRLDAGDYRVATFVRPAAGSEELWRVRTRVTWSDGELDLETLIYRPERSPLARSGP